MGNGKASRTLKERAAGKSTLAIGGVSSPFDSFVLAESSQLRTNFCAKKPAHRKSAKRYVQTYKTRLLPIKPLTILTVLH